MHSRPPEVSISRAKAPNARILMLDEAILERKAADFAILRHEMAMMLTRFSQDFLRRDIASAGAIIDA